MDENDIIERRACISGIGQSQIARRLEASPMELTLEYVFDVLPRAASSTSGFQNQSLTRYVADLRLGPELVSFVGFSSLLVSAWIFGGGAKSDRPRPPPWIDRLLWLGRRPSF